MPKSHNPRYPCYGGETIVTVMNEITNKIEKVPVKNLVAGVHHAYSIDKARFIPLVHVAKVGHTKRMMVLRKSSVSKSPLHDIYLSKNIRLLSQGKIVRMRDMVTAEKLRIDKEPRYVLVTSDPEFIMVSGVAVQTKGQEQFEEYLRKRSDSMSMIIA